MLLNQTRKQLFSDVDLVTCLYLSRLYARTGVMVISDQRTLRKVAAHGSRCFLMLYMPMCLKFPLSTHISLIQHPLDESLGLDAGTGKYTPLTSQLFKTWYASITIVISALHVAKTIC